MTSTNFDKTLKAISLFCLEHKGFNIKFYACAYVYSFLKYIYKHFLMAQLECRRWSTTLVVPTAPLQMEQTCGRHSCWSRQWLLAGYAGACLLAVLAGHAGAWLLVVLSDHAAACLLVVLAGCACFLAGIGGAVKLRSSTSVCLFFFMSVSVFLVFLNNPPTPTQPNTPQPTLPHPTPPRTHTTAPPHTPTPTTHHTLPHPPLTTRHHYM